MLSTYLQMFQIEIEMGLSGYGKYESEVNTR